MSAETAHAQQTPWTHYTLSNGLEVILEERHDTPRVAVEVDYHVGRRDQPDGCSGLAHLTEHLMFTWARARPNGDAVQFLSSVGTEHAVGMTSNDVTRYAEVVTSSALERVLAFESDRMGFLLDHIDQRKLEAQRLIIAREREERALSFGSRDAFAMLIGTLYGTAHPYRFAIEQPTDAMSLTLDDVRWFHQRWYVPSNATLVVVGDFETAQARRWIERYFASLARVARPERAQATAVRLTAEQTLITPGARFEDRLVLAWSTPALGAEDDAELDLIADLLAGNVLARLTQRLTRDTPVALGVDASQVSEALGSMFFISAVTSDRRPAEILISHIDAELARLRTEEIALDELRGVQSQRLIAMRENQSTIDGRADWLATWARMGGPLEHRAREAFERYQRVTPRSIRRAARRWLSTTSRVVLINRARTTAQPTHSTTVVGALR